MKITVRYFALLREQVGLESETLLWDEAEPSVGRLRRHLAARAPAASFLGEEGALLIAVNRRYADPDTPLRDGDEVAFFPPVAGG